ncbi:MAG: toll/interleukin-1 receptor domain-containing protein [Bacteroidetes bacterium]|nr:toll/interleukin-1 receptor domain-containing protein [Bacteroidota bacterium]
MNDSLDFDYEIAFSLLDQDKKIAEELQKRLGNTDKIFLYSTDKKELAFKNAIPVLQNIYKHRSRLVIILHRENYGISSWTLIEKEAIMSRQLLTQNLVLHIVL